jgi:S-adenosylmethionine synthetase
MNDYAMSIAEKIIDETSLKVIEGEITFDDTEKIYIEKLTHEEINALGFLGIHDEFDFRETIENES